VELFNNKLTIGHNKSIVTFGYNPPIYGFFERSSLVSLLISVFIFVDKRDITIFNSFLYFVGYKTKNPRL